MGDCPGPRKETAIRGNVTPGVTSPLPMHPCPACTHQVNGGLLVPCTMHHHSHSDTPLWPLLVRARKCMAYKGPCPSSGQAHNMAIG